MTADFRSHWRNCAIEADDEMREIDRLEDEIAPLAPEAAKIRELISVLELCHHKAERWVYNIIEAIGRGETDKGSGTRKPGQTHPAEQVWQSACAVLSAWCEGRPAAAVNLYLGERTPLKEWQVHRVTEKIRSFLGGQYVYLLFSGGEYESLYRTECPTQYNEHEDFWLATVRTLIHDTEDGRATALSLGLAIDMLWPCHWSFLENLQIVLEAIGGKLKPARPFAACGRNITLLPIRGRMETVSTTLRVFCGHPGGQTDRQILSELGEPTTVRRWLAASLDKTIRLQLDPPAGVRAISALTGPEWIYPTTMPLACGGTKSPAQPERLPHRYPANL